MKKLKNILHSKKVIVLIFLITLIYVVISLLLPKHSIYQGNENIFVCTITNLYKTDYSRLDLDCKEDLIGNYYGNKNLQIGDVVRINGTLKEIESLSNQGIFNYRKYLNNKGIYYKLTIEDIMIIKRPLSIYSIKNYIINRISNLKCFPYINALILGDKNYLDTKDIYQKSGIIHLFSISGMHLSIIISTLKRLIKKDNYLRDMIVLTIILLYYLLIRSNSLLRAIIFYFINFLNNKLNLRLSIKHKLFYLLIIILLINPSNITNSSFLYSYIISAALVLLGKRISSINNYLLRLIYVSFISFAISFPLNTYYYSEINILSFISNIISVPFLSFIIYPCILIVLLFPKLDNLGFFIITIFNSIISFLSSNGINLIFYKSVIFVIIYYLLICLLFKSKKLLIVLLITITIHFNYNYLFPKNYIMFIDVGQGDSTLLHINDTNILLDTGGNISFDLSKNVLLPVIKSKGIAKIDSLVITHGDFDHMGEAINLVNNFKVDKVIFNCGEYNDLEQELIKKLDKKKIKYYSCIKELNIDDNKLYFLQTKEYDNENDNSNVIYTELNGYKFMFMGDASISTEKEIIDKYNLPDIDVLKVGHHGSRTSSGKGFIDEINPKYSVISVGMNNRYGHPNEEVLNNLENTKIYRTDQDGSIMFKIKNNKLMIETCSP